MTDRHPSSSPQHPRVAQLPSALHLLAAFLGLHHGPVEPAQGGDTGGLAPLALPVVLRQRQEVGTTYLNYFNAMTLITKELNNNFSGFRFSPDLGKYSFNFPQIDSGLVQKGGGGGFSSPESK